MLYNLIPPLAEQLIFANLFRYVTFRAEHLADIQSRVA